MSCILFATPVKFLVALLSDQTTSYQHGIGTIEARLSSLNTLHSTAISQSKEMEEGLKTTKDEVPGIDEVIDNSFEKDVRLCVSENSHAFAVMEALNVTNSSAASKTKETLQEAKNGEDIASHGAFTLVASIYFETNSPSLVFARCSEGNAGETERYQHRCEQEYQSCE